MLNVQSLTQRTFAQIVVFALLLLNSTLAFAQNQVNGIVTDKTGEPLIGVNVVEKGTTNGVITDFNGQFTRFYLFTWGFFSAYRCGNGTLLCY